MYLSGYKSVIASYLKTKYGISHTMEQWEALVGIIYDAYKLAVKEFKKPYITGDTQFYTFVMQKTALSKQDVILVLDAIHVLSLNGEISAEVYNPVLVAESKAAFPSAIDKLFPAGLSDIGGKITLILGLVAAIVIIPRILPRR